MTEGQLYLAVGVPVLFNGMMFTVLAIFIHSISGRLTRVEDRLDHVIGSLNELDKRITKVELKLGIQP